MSLVISIIKLLTNIILSILLLIGASTALWVCVMMAFLIVAKKIKMDTVFLLEGDSHEEN